MTTITGAQSFSSTQLATIGKEASPIRMAPADALAVESIDVEG
jgi:hypothetical protein